jgi:hypothetical protein
VSRLHGERLLSRRTWAYSRVCMRKRP